MDRHPTSQARALGPYLLELLRLPLDGLSKLLILQEKQSKDGHEHYVVAAYTSNLSLSRSASLTHSPPCVSFAPSPLSHSLAPVLATAPMSDLTPRFHI